MDVAQVLSLAGPAPLSFLFRPPRAGSGAGRRPLVVLLHEGDDHGKGDEARLDLPPSVLATHFHDAFFLAVQLPPRGSGAGWDEALFQLVDVLASRYPVDRDRLVLAGFSLAPARVWHVGVEHAERFAGALVLFGSTPDHAGPARSWSWRRIWASLRRRGRGTGEDGGPRAMAAALREQGAPMRYALLRDGGGGIDQAVDADPALARWLAELAPRRRHAAFGEVRRGVAAADAGVPGLQAELCPQPGC